MNERDDSIKGVKAITPSDTTIVGGYNAFTVTGAGNIDFEFEDGSTLTWAFAVGEIWKFRPKYVKTTSTATGIIAMKTFM